MVKKRQPDFPKRQPKPGRLLNRKKSMTDTSFKSKTIMIREKKVISQKSELSIPDFMKSLRNGSTAKQQTTSLSHLDNMVLHQQELFAPYMAEVFESVVPLVIVMDLDVRNPAIKLMEHIFECSDSKAILRISTFIPLLVQTLSCGMKNAGCKESTLKLLQCILRNKPILICHSREIFKNFYNMLTAANTANTVTLRKQSRNLQLNIRLDPSSSIMYRIEVLECMELFLREMLKKSEIDNVVEEEKDEQEIYWNCESPLHLEIYAGGGLKPVDIEKSSDNNFNLEDLNFANPSDVKEFIIPVVTVIPEIFKEIIGDHGKSDDNHFPDDTIKNLNLLFQVLCYLTDWMQLIQCEEVGNLICKFLENHIFLQNLFPLFPYDRLPRNKPENQGKALVFNLAVCFLHGKLILEDDYTNDKYIDSILTYIKTLFGKNYEVKYNSIPMLVKILKRYFELKKTNRMSEFIGVTLEYLSKLLKYADDRSNGKVLISLFIKLSLDPLYRSLIDKEAMKNWFTWLLDQITNIPESGKVDKNLLQIAKRIANRKYPNFLQAVAKIDDNKYKAMLKYDNPDVRDTVIFLIYNQIAISASFFEDISNVILLDTSFPVQYAIRFIRLLTCRYTEKHRSMDTDDDKTAFRTGRINFIQFLLNIAVDTLSMTNEKWWCDYDANEYTKALKPFQDVTEYNVFPSLHWKEHSKLFEVCQKSLSLMPEKLVNNVTCRMFIEILDNIRNFPMHCAIAILKLNNHEIRDKYYRCRINYFMFSTLLTISVLTHMSTEDEWYKYNVFVPTESMEFSRRTALETLQRQLENTEEIDGIAVYHILRICQFYRERQLFKPEDRDKVLNILKGFKEKCTDKTFKHQPLFVKLCSVFFYYG